VVALTAMWKHTRWALWLAAKRPDLYQPGSAEARPWWASVWLPVAVVLLALALQVGHVHVPLIGSGWATHDPEYWPVDVLDVLQAHQPKPGDPHNKLFNSGYIDGGFVIYHAPGYKVFVDDRCEVFGGEWLKHFCEVAQSSDPAPALREWDEQYKLFDFALTRTGTSIDDVFKASPAWEVVKVTPVATFYKRK